MSSYLYKEYNNKLREKILHGTELISSPPPPKSQEKCDSWDWGGRSYHKHVATLLDLQLESPESIFIQNYLCTSKIIYAAAKLSHKVLYAALQCLNFSSAVALDDPLWRSGCHLSAHARYALLTSSSFSGPEVLNPRACRAKDTSDGADTSSSSSVSVSELQFLDFSERARLEFL